MKTVLSLIVVACAALSLGFAGQRKTTQAKQKTAATYHAYLEATGSKQGKFKGKIAVASMSYSQSSGYDRKSGQPSGKRGHSTCTIVIDASDAKQFDTAMKTHEALTDVSITDYRAGGAASGGKVVAGMMTKMMNAFVDNMKTSFSGGKETTQITLSYQSIRTTRTKGGKGATDAWNSR